MSEHPEMLEPSWERISTLLAAGQIGPDVGLTVRPSDIKQGIDALRGRAVDGRVVIDFTAGGPGWRPWLIGGRRRCGWLMR